jgi:ankyrin repeat protein
MPHEDIIMFSIKELRRREIKLTDIARKSGGLDFVMLVLNKNLERMVYNLLRHAASSGNIDLLKYLVEEEIFSPNSNDETFLDTLLGLAILDSVCSGDCEIMDYLLTEENCRKHIDRYVVSYNTPDKYQDFWLDCFHAACTSGNLGAVKYLLYRNLVDDDASSINLGGVSLMEAAARAGNTELVEYLYKNCKNKNLHSVSGVGI